MSSINTFGAAANLVTIGSSTLSLLPLGKALFKDPNPPKGIDGFVFDIKMSERVDYSADITDHYTEFNYAIQDHIALNPIKVTLVGKVGELIWREPVALAFARAAISRLGALGVLSPGQSATATNALANANTAVNAYRVAEKTFDSMKSFLDGGNYQNAQQKAFTTFEDYFNRRTLLTIETPWKHYENMAIESWTAEQDDKSIYETVYTLNFKEMNFVETTSVNGYGVINRALNQKSPSKNRGSQKGELGSWLHKNFVK